MKRFLFLAIVACGVFALAVPGWSLTIDTTTQVGVVDPLVDATELANSGFATELDWVQSFVPGATLTVFDGSSYNWILVDGASNTWASLLQDSPDYFFLKTGAGQGTNDHFLFQNLAELTYAVVDFDATGVEIRNVGAISHVGETGGTPQVPEASTLMLLGFGLAGVGTIRRFLKR